jgi:predicted 3-demethylubiquinone-9 3-methyltransferase (glyoxalase superfamily)
VPVKLFELMEDPKKSDKVMAAVMEMKKLDLSKLEEAAKS